MFNNPVSFPPNVIYLLQFNAYLQDPFLSISHLSVNASLFINVKLYRPFRDEVFQKDKVLFQESELNYKPYVGYAWSASKTKRAAFRIDNNPSPADYYVKLDCKPINHQDEEYREMARLLTFLPRYIEAKQLQTVSEVSTKSITAYTNFQSTLYYKPS